MVMVVLAPRLHASEIWAPASTVESKVMTGAIAGLGDVRVRIDEVGEPISRPVRIQVEVSCGEEESFKAALQDEKACAFRDLAYDSKANALKVRVGQYDPDAARCSGDRTVTVSLKQACRRH